MIKNFICENCDHQFVCERQTVLEKFDDNSKKYIRIDITMDDCKDFSCSDGEDE